MESQKAEIKIETLSPQELIEIQKQLENDIQSLRQSFQGMKLAASKFQESKGVVASLATDVEDKEIMVPLTSSLYIPGKICDKGTAIIEVGAGYFIEMSLDKASEYCDRKFNLMNGNAKKVADIIDVKATHLQAVNATMQKKIAEITGKDAAAAK